MHEDMERGRKMIDQPRLSWLGGKTRPSHGDTRKNRPGRKEEHTEALYEAQFKEKKDDVKSNLSDHQGQGSGMAS